MSGRDALCTALLAIFPKTHMWEEQKSREKQREYKRTIMRLIKAIRIAKKPNRMPIGAWSLMMYKIAEDKTQLYQLIRWAHRCRSNPAYLELQTPISVLHGNDNIHSLLTLINWVNPQPQEPAK